MAIELNTSGEPALLVALAGPWLTTGLSVMMKPESDGVVPFGLNVMASLVSVGVGTINPTKPKLF